MESRAKLAGHAIHPMVIVSPPGWLATAALFDALPDVLGYEGRLFLLAVDHGASCRSARKAKQGALTPAAAARVSEAKASIHDGFLRTLEWGVPRAAARDQVDEAFGSEVARGAGGAVAARGRPDSRLLRLRGGPDDLVRGAAGAPRRRPCGSLPAT